MGVVFATILVAHTIASRVLPSREDAVAIAVATCIVIVLVRRWRVVVPDHSAQLGRMEMSRVLGDVFLPFNGWAMEPAALERLLSWIQVDGHESIVEFGSGLSTLALARVIDQRGRGRLISFEEDERWCRLVRGIIAHERLDGVAEVVHAPLEPYQGDEGIPWYAVPAIEQALAGTDRADLVIVDGPISRRPMSRYPVLPVLVHLGVVDATTRILLDDADRDHEVAVIDRWCDELPVDIERLGGSGRGQALVHMREAQPSSSSSTPPGAVV